MVVAARQLIRCTSRLFSSHSNVLIEDQGSVRILSINRPNKMNCVDSHTSQELFSAFKHFENDTSVTVGILTGKGDTFCSGYDLKELSSVKAKDDMPIPLEPYSINSRGPMGPTRLLLTKPVIACISGYAVAGGLELALWCDLRIAEENAKMGVFCRKHGVPLIDGGTVRLPMLIGLSQALDLILTGREISAAEGFRMGLVNRVVTNGTGLKEALKLANQIASFPQECMRTDRLSAINSANDQMGNSMNQEFKEGTQDTIINRAIVNSQNFIKKSN